MNELVSDSYSHLAVTVNALSVSSTGIFANMCDIQRVLSYSNISQSQWISTALEIDHHLLFSRTEVLKIM